MGRVNVVLHYVVPSTAAQPAADQTLNLAAVLRVTVNRSLCQSVYLMFFPFIIQQFFLRCCDSTKHLSTLAIDLQVYETKLGTVYFLYPVHYC